MRLTDPFRDSPELDAVVSSGLADEVATLREFASPATVGELNSATTGEPISIRKPLWLDSPGSFQEYFMGPPNWYLVPVIAAGQPVGEFTVNASGGKLGVGVFVDGLADYPAYVEASAKLSAALGEGAQLTCTPRPYPAVVGWSAKGEGAVFISSMARPCPPGLQLGEVVLGDEALGYAKALWGPAAP